MVRVSPQLPKLPDWCADSAPIDFNDWLTCLEVYIEGLAFLPIPNNGGRQRRSWCPFGMLSI